MERCKKETVVAEMNQLIRNSQAVLVTDFKGIPMEQLSTLRAKLREVGCDYHVAKNTLMKLAAKDTPMEQLSDMMVGNNAFGFTTGDPAGLAKALSDFAKTNDKFVIKGGVLSGKTLNPAQIKALANLPSREVMLGTLLGTMNAVPTNFVRVLAAVPQKLVYCLAAIRDQKEAA